MSEPEIIKEGIELVKTAINEGGKVREFIDKHFTGSLAQKDYLISQRFKHKLFFNELKFFDKATKKINALGLEGQLEPLPLKISIPLLEGVAIEDDDQLQSLWVNLLINSSDKHYNTDFNNIYIELLKNLTSIEAKMINFICRNITNNNYESEALKKEFYRKFHDFNDKTASLNFKLAIDSLINKKLIFENQSGFGKYNSFKPTRLCIGFYLAVKER